MIVFTILVYKICRFKSVLNFYKVLAFGPVWTKRQICDAPIIDLQIWGTYSELHVKVLEEENFSDAAWKIADLAKQNWFEFSH